MATIAEVLAAVSREARTGKRQTIPRLESNANANVKKVEAKPKATPKAARGASVRDVMSGAHTRRKMREAGL